MANVTISELTPTTSVVNTLVVPTSDGTTTTKLTLSQIANLVMPVGSIIMWSGASVPSGWSLCNGQTVAGYGVVPDLRDKFVIGSSATRALNSTGGVASTSVSVAGSVSNSAITVPGDGHVHDYGYVSVCSVQCGDSTCIGGCGETGTSGGNYGGSSATVNSISNSTVNSTGTVATIPPYYALAFIIKTS